MPPAREPERAPSPATQIEALQRSAGNAAVAGLLGRRPAAGPVLARTLDAKIGSFGLSQAPVTPARLRELMQTVEDAWGRMEADPVQASYASPEKIDRWRKQFATELAAALAAIGKDAPADPEQVG
ncbi:MAG TPA: hypothetical protein VFN44_23955, partial [Solirubrobacteraceae bacterium]|nr:hypothetical protein [Solirubrobacteraceae bacterium]